MSKAIRNTLNIVLPIVLGCAILYWMYRGFDFGRVADTLCHATNWWWMALSLVFGVTAQVFRGLRWRQSLAPIGENPSTMNCIHAVFVSYATSLVIPRSGEVARCGILTRYDGTSFSKALGTVVTERIIDSLLIMGVAVVVVVLQIGTFARFFNETGTNFSQWMNTFTTTGYVVSAVCAVAVLVLLAVLLKRVSMFARMQKVLGNLKAGIFSLKEVENKWLFALYTFGIWGSYFVHFYLTFFCFEWTAGLSVMTALVAFVVGSLAVIVPTPNGMGSWHFAVKTILVLAGVNEEAKAELFVLIVHAVQTALIPVLGIWSGIALLRKKALVKTVGGFEQSEHPELYESSGNSETSEHSNLRKNL